MTQARSDAETRVSRIAGSNIRRLRTAANLTQRQVADGCREQGIRMHAEQMSRLERGTAYGEAGGAPTLTVDQLTAIATVLGTSPADLLTDTAVEHGTEWGVRTETGYVLGPYTSRPLGTPESLAPNRTLLSRDVTVTRGPWKETTA